MTHKVSIINDHDDHGYYAYCPDLPGCQSLGDTLEEAIANIREAMELYLETLDINERQKLLPADG